MPEPSVLHGDARAGGRTYSETVARGFYGRYVGGLSGKYDNVRTYWEDQVTRLALRPYVKERVALSTAQGRGVRVVDLGCGAGQGYELLTRIPEKDLDLEHPLRHVLPPSRMARYLGLDLSESMVSQGRENYRDVAHVSFQLADLREGLGPALSEPPFDIYFSSYGATSHLDTASLRWCLGDILRHARPGALVVLDLIGRYSLEWPAYWHVEDDADKVREYSMSYLYDEEERRNGDIERFPIRFWTGTEVQELCRELSAAWGVQLEVLRLMDRSLFVGRHVDTREYGCSLPPLRQTVNSLYEVDVRTRLDRLRVNYRPIPGTDELNQFFTSLAACWNRLVDFTIERLPGNRSDLVAMDGWQEFPQALQVALMNMDRVVDSVAWIKAGDVRANIVEPQLAYLLRNLEHTMQRGQGCGHALMAMLRVSGPTHEA